MPQIDKYIQGGKYVAYEPNTKSSQKPDADMYHYIEITLPDGSKAYVGIEHNYKLDRYIVHDITRKLRPTAIPK